MDLSRLALQQWIALIRCAATLIIIVMYPKQYGIVQLTFVGGGIALYSLSTLRPSLWKRFLLSRGELTAAIDAILAALLVYATGGMKSPFIGVLYLPVLEAAVGLSFRSMIGIALWTLCWLGYFGAIQGFQQTVSISAYQRLWAFGSSAVLLGAAFNTMGRLARRYEQRIRNLEAETAKLVELAERDPLTGAWNRRAFNERLEAELNRARRSGDPFSLIFIDINDMKRINDVMGHEAGDAALISLTAHLSQCSRTQDVVSRYGGDEFAILLPATTPEGMDTWVNRVRTQKDAPVPEFSLGSACFPLDGADSQSLFRKADEALYIEKADKARVALKNRVRA